MVSQENVFNNMKKRSVAVKPRPKAVAVGDDIINHNTHQRAEEFFSSPYLVNPYRYCAESPTDVSVKMSQLHISVEYRQKKFTAKWVP